jgi:sugar/nucleoside kinase (ribokinase family)
LGDWCRNVKFIKLNISEYGYNEDIIKESPWLTDKVIVTLDKNGAIYMDDYFPTISVDNPDVSGAGDTFVAAFTVEYLNTNNIQQSIIFANGRASEVVKHKGVTIWFKDL